MQVIVLKIDDIIETTDRAVKVRLADSDKTPWLPRRICEYYPGKVVIPMWLYKRINIERSKNGRISN